MASLNRVMLLGNLTRDPEVRFTPQGRAVTDLRLAVSRKYKGADDQLKEDTCYVDVVVWGRQAETCGEYLKKGSQALIEGRLQLDEWEQDGQKRNKLRVVASNVQFMSRPQGQDAAPTAAPAAPATPAPATPAPAVEPAPQAPSATGDEPPLEDSDNLPF